MDRDAAAERVLARLAAARSAWDPADLRGEVEQLIAAEGGVVAAAVRSELAEDRPGPAAVRAAAGPRPRPRPGSGVRPGVNLLAVLDVEADLAARRAAPATDGPAQRQRTTAIALAGRLDAGQAAPVTALAGDPRLLVVEGAAGAGKTATLAATREALDEQGTGWWW